MNDGADFQQQQELEDMQQWLAENKEKFNEIFGANDDGLHDTKQD